MNLYLIMNLYFIFIVTKEKKQIHHSLFRAKQTVNDEYDRVPETALENTIGSHILEYLSKQALNKPDFPYEI